MTEFKDAICNKDIPVREFVYTVEIVLRETDLSGFELEEAVDKFRERGSFDIVEVEELHHDDPRRVDALRW
jgi:hypothetical protein